MIVYVCNDLIFSSRIRALAEDLGIEAESALDIESLRALLPETDGQAQDDAMTGAVVDLDLGQTALQVVAAIKSHDPTIPVVAFGPHVQPDLLAAARAQGADAVMPRSRFSQDMAGVLRRLGNKAE